MVSVAVSLCDPALARDTPERFRDVELIVTHCTNLRFTFSLLERFTVKRQERSVYVGVDSSKLETIQR